MVKSGKNYGFEHGTADDDIADGTATDRGVGTKDEVDARDGIVNGAPPTMGLATPGASATNPELMPNDAVFPDVPLFAGSPRKPPELDPKTGKALDPRRNPRY